MNINIMKVLLVAGGAMLGSGVTWLSIRKHYADQAQAEIDDVKEYFEAASKYAPTPAAEVAVEVVEQKEMWQGPHESIVKVDPTTMVATLKGDIRDYTKPGAPVLPPREPDMTPRPVLAPVIISEPQFYNEHDEFDKAFWTYFQEDDVLADERDEPVISVKLGQAALDLMRVPGQTHVCIRIGNESADYHVSINEGAYGKIVDGRDPDDSE